MKQQYTVKDYFAELVNYGGILTPRGEVIKDLERMGASRRQIDLYLMGLDERKGD